MKGTKMVILISNTLANIRRIEREKDWATSKGFSEWKQREMEVKETMREEGKQAWNLDFLTIWAINEVPWWVYFIPN